MSLAAVPAPPPPLTPEQIEPAFPKPDPAAAFAALKIYDAAGNPVRVPREDWAGARARVAADPKLAAWVQTQRAETDDWMAKRHDKVEWVCGWWHDFVSPKDGSHLTFTPEEPGPETLHSPSDPKVALTPKLHGAWVFIFRTKNQFKMIEAARLYRLTGEKKYADWAAGQLDFYADNLMKWPPAQGGKARLMFQSLDDATSIVNFVQTARILGDYVTPERKKKWGDELFKPEAHLLQQSLQTIHNIACWQRSAVGQVALYCHDPELWREAVEAPNGIKDQVARGVTSDYLWHEQSLGYNSYVVQALSSFFAYAQMEGRGAELQPEMETVENLMLAPIMMRFPTGQLPNPADSTGLLHVPDLEFMAGVAPLFPTKPGIYQMEHEPGWAGLLDPPSEQVEQVELPPAVSWNLQSSLMAIIRSGPWQVYFHYGQLTRSHAQAEALNWEAFFNDTDVTHDPGTTGYGSPMTREYYQTGLCANVPLVDGLGQESWGHGQLDSFSANAVAASQPHYRAQASASRRLSIDGDALTDVSSITTRDGRPHALGFVLHLQGHAALPPDFVPEPNMAAVEPVAGFKYLRDATRAKFHDQASFEVAFGAVTLRIGFALPGDFTVWHASAPDQPPARNEVFYLETRGTSATLETTLAPMVRK